MKKMTSPNVLLHLLDMSGVIQFAEMLPLVTLPLN